VVKACIKPYISTQESFWSSEWHWWWGMESSCRLSPWSSVQCRLLEGEGSEQNNVERTLGTGNSRGWCQKTTCKLLSIVLKVVLKACILVIKAIRASHEVSVSPSQIPVIFLDNPILVMKSMFVPPTHYLSLIEMRVFTYRPVHTKPWIIRKNVLSCFIVLWRRFTGVGV
jgi:hypothetical protein